MFSSNVTVFIDACSLASVLRRNLLLSLAEADLFRVRWSRLVLDETERAIVKMLVGRQVANAEQFARKAVTSMEVAFDDAMVASVPGRESVGRELPDPGDAHVLAAAVQARAAIIVTENLKHFPLEAVAPFSIRVRSADAFIAERIAADPGTAVFAVKRMRERMNRPERSADVLLMDMKTSGLTSTVDALLPHAQSL